MLAGLAGYETWILSILGCVSRLLPSADARPSFAGGGHLSMDFRGNFEFCCNIFSFLKSEFFNPRCTETAKCKARSSEGAL